LYIQRGEVFPDEILDGKLFLEFEEEDDEMRKMSSAAILVCMITLLSTISTAVHASTPAKKTMPVSGTWFWWADIVSQREAGGNLFIYATEHDEFHGTFEGFGEGPFTVVLHPEGFMTGRGRTVFTGTVDGKSGTLVIQWVGNTKTLGRWKCMWVILSGTGELANLRGQGIGVETAAGSYTLDLSGKIVFAPD
jgi:hypothetical protein